MDLHWINGDLPKRTQIKGLQGHNAVNGCEICTAQAVSFKPKDKQGRQLRAVRCWPDSTAGKPHRNLEEYRQQSEAARINRYIDPKDNGGVKGMGNIFLYSN